MNAQPNNPNDERLRILRLVEEGKVTASEGISLLEALERGRKTARIPSRAVTGAPNNSGGPRWLRVRPPAPRSVRPPRETVRTVRTR